MFGLTLVIYRGWEVGCFHMGLGYFQMTLQLQCLRAGHPLYDHQSCLSNGKLLGANCALLAKE